MRFMDVSLSLELQRELEGTRAEISHLGSESYHEDIKSWSETCEKEAVRISGLRPIYPHRIADGTLGSNCQRHF
jgi:hypothetical protein